MVITTKIKQKQTSKQARKPVEYAGFWIRLLARLIDFLGLWTFGFMLIGIPQVLAYGSPDNWPDDPSAFSIILTLVFLFIYVAYDIVAIKKYGTTIGKNALGLKVVSASSEPIGWGRAIIRKIVYNITSAWFFLFHGALWIIWDKKKQGLHDKAAETYVIKR